MIFKPFFDTILKVKRDNKEESMDYKTELIKNKLSEMESHVNDSNDASLKNEFYELKNLISSKLDNVKYGLVFEESKEDIEIKCETMIPYLEREREINASAKNGKNFLIEGDNYASLKLLEKTHKGKIDIIYIDPPYNTGNKDFTYNDKFVDVEDGYRHSKWLSFMFKRLKLARDLLTEDGVIFISIDDNEQTNLRLLCDYIFGESNFITQFIWEKTQHFGRQKINFYSNCEYVICYAKKIYSSEIGKLKELLVEKIKTDLTDAPLYNASNKTNTLVFPPNSVKFNLKDGIYETSDNESYELLEKVEVKNEKNATDLVLRFKSRWSQDTVNEELKKGTIFWVKSKGFAIRAIYHEGKTAKESPKQLIFTNSNNPLCSYTRFGQKVGVNEEGSNDLSRLVDQNIFSYPKPTSLIKYLLNLYYDFKNNLHKSEFTVLDFFAGSGTTGQAVLELNKEDGGNRHFILCTNNENNICEDVTYERLKTVITGKRKDGSIYRENPYEDNLTYLKVNFVGKKDDVDFCKICEQLINLKSSTETCPSFVFDKEEDFYEFLNSNIYLDDCVVYLLDDILLPSGSKLKECKMEIRELPKYFYTEEELINNDII